MKEMWKYANSITTFSKILAAVLFIILPVISFWVGYYLNSSKEIAPSNNNNEQQAIASVTPTSEVEKQQVEVSDFPSITAVPIQFEPTVMKNIDVTGRTNLGIELSTEYLHCSEIQLSANIPSGSKLTSLLLNGSVSECMNVNIRNRDYVANIFVFDPGVGCTDITGAVSIGKLSNDLEVYRFTQYDMYDRFPTYSYHTYYDKDGGECSGVTQFAPLIGYGAMAISCQGDRTGCDSMVKSIEVNAAMGD